MKNTGVRLCPKEENEDSIVKQTKTGKIVLFLNVIKDVIYYAGAPIADEVMNEAGRGRRRRG